MLKLFYSRITPTGLENIPAHRPVIFLPNHQNAFMDGILVNTRHKRTTHSLIRASIFGNRFSDFLLRSLNLMPIYRIRDGLSQLERNQLVFDECFEILNKNECLLIHPEGNHNIKKQVRHISKGFTRIALGAIEKYPNLPLVLIPVGINYSHSRLFFGRVSIHFSKPIEAHDFAGRPLDLKAEVEAALRKSVFHIDDENYHSEYSTLKSLRTDFSDYRTSYVELNRIRLNPSLIGKKIKRWISPFHYLILLNNLFVVLLWKIIERRIKDEAFISSIKFCFGMILVPIIYIVKVYFVSQYFSPSAGLLYLLLSILTLPLLSSRYRFF